MLLWHRVRELADLVIHAVEQSRHHWEEGGLECFNVVHEEGDIPLVEAHPGPVAEHRHLGTQKFI